MLQWLRRFERGLHSGLRRLAGRSRSRYETVGWEGLSAEQAFSRIYSWRLWGGDGGFYSGTGSRDPQVVEPYLAAVRAWVGEQGPLDAVDLGCGDFHIGGHLRPMFRTFVACDVVPAMIEHHKAGPFGDTVTFLCLDLVRDPLPAGDVAFLRQVLQHLPNAMIAAILPKLSAYRWLILTEHLPATPDFIPNRDKPIGPGIRLSQASGVDLSAPPFDLKVREAHLLCEVPQYGGVIRTVLYRLQE